jgi:hypothetical protein
VYRRQLAQPVHSIAYTDLTGDGVNELVCVTFDAVYIFQVSQPRVPGGESEGREGGSHTLPRHTWTKARPGFDLDHNCRVDSGRPLVTGLWAHSHRHARVCSMTWTARPTCLGNGSLPRRGR